MSELFKLFLQVQLWMNIGIMAIAVILLFYYWAKAVYSEHQNKRDDAKSTVIRIFIWTFVILSIVNIFYYTKDLLWVDNYSQQWNKQLYQDMKWRIDFIDNSSFTTKDYENFINNQWNWGLNRNDWF